MNNLEKFIQQNKEAFDTHEPSEALWSRIQKSLEENDIKPKQKIVLSNWRKWAVAAAVVLVGGASTVLFLQKNKPSRPLAVNIKKDNNFTNNDSQNVLLNEPAKDTPIPNAPDSRDLKKAPQKLNIPINTAPSINEELYHYTKLIEIKQQQMSFLKTQSPELYENFSADLKRLDDNYFELKQKLEAGYNSEKLLEAMIKNLKLQTELLNRQLEITKRLNHKSENNETVNSL